MSRKTSLLFIGVGIACLIGIVYAMLNYPSQGATILGWALFLGQLAYSYSERLYWLLQSVKCYAVNPETQWSLSVRYSLDDWDETTMAAVRHALGTAAVRDRPTIRDLSSHRFEIRADELTMEVVTSHDEGCYLEVFFEKLPVSFRGSEKAMSERIRPALESLEGKIRARTKQYHLTVYFGKLNPYFGLYMRRLRQEDISLMTIKVTNHPEGMLDISKEKISIYTSSLGRLDDSVKKYLTLSELPA